MLFTVPGTQRPFLEALGVDTGPKMSMGLVPVPRGLEAPSFFYVCGT